MDKSIQSGKIGTVAVIGAGLSGIASTAHLLRTGIDVTVFERANVAGGAWEFSPETDQDPPFPSTRPPAPDWDKPTADDLSSEKAPLRFSPPGPAYANMKGRNSEQTMRTSLGDWPEGKRAPLDHSEVAAYLQRIAKAHRVQDKIRFRTRVESVTKQGEQWRLQTAKLVTKSIGYALERETWLFDAVVVAAGRYGDPRVPDIPGLSAWKHAHANRILHSKQYRAPEPYQGKTVLIIGGFISAMEITNELVNNGAKVYESAKDTRVDFRGHSNHENAEKVAMAIEFTTVSSENGQSTVSPQTLHNDDPIPGKVVLQDGRVLEGIHYVIIATGYHTSFPFLGPLLERPSMALEDADERVIITSDGRTAHNLHEDIFYIPDPTLAFIGITHFASTFSMYDFQAQVLAAVFAERVALPPKAAMQAEQKRRKSRVLPGTFLNSIFILDDFVIHRMLHWVNEGMVARGFEPLQGPDRAWWEAFGTERKNARPLLKDLQDNFLSTYGTDWDKLVDLY
ncbi:FAD dependent oxidoreductase [Hypoxylon sp. NC1633]|nr:FAD dependent oxidoreductase [Hypoxylon sp. NC1633]